MSDKLKSFRATRDIFLWYCWDGGLF
jgi:hypothetical protein